MAKFNLKHFAKKEEDATSYNKMLEDVREDTDVTEKNINLSIDKKDNDVTIPFEKQLEASRTDEINVIAEKGMDGKKMYNDKRKDLDGTTISPINLVSIKEDKEHSDKYKKAESEQDLETKFWDKCLGVQAVSKNKKMPKPIKDNQLQNNPERFNKMNKDVYKVKPEKMVTASLMDADALIFNIYAKSIKEGREINSEERNILDRINNEKILILANTVRKEESFALSVPITKLFKKFPSLNNDPNFVGVSLDSEIIIFCKCNIESDGTLTEYNNLIIVPTIKDNINNKVKKINDTTLINAIEKVYGAEISDKIRIIMEEKY